MRHSLLAGKAVSKISKLQGRSGSTWPGHIALKTDKSFIRKIINRNPNLKIVLVAGTNGKTTTTKALSHILTTNNITSITNRAGANLLNGLASTLVLKSGLNGKINAQALIFEVDENSLPKVLDEVPNPDCIILLNLFRDQLDRYGEVNSIAKKWKNALMKLSDKTLVVANSDDALLAFVAGFSKKNLFFTIDGKYKRERTLSHAVDSTTCPNCNNSLVFSRIAYSHLGDYVCPSCNLKNPKAKQYDFSTKLLGTYNIYNLTSAILVADKVFNIIPHSSSLALNTFTPAFGRQESFIVDNKKILLLLSKNPTGFNENLKVVLTKKNASLLILLNDRIPDGQDISWIWDVDFEVLKDNPLNVFVSGDRSYDMANRLFFANVPNNVFGDYKEAYREALTKTQAGKMLFILPTYSALLEIRKLISGKSIL